MPSKLDAVVVPRAIHGVDFSGAADAGRKIWIASGAMKGNNLHIEECRPGEALPNSGRDRTTCLAALRDVIATAEASVYGFDFPFGLPTALVPQHCWEDFVLSFGDTFSSPGEFRRICREAGSGSELKRLTDADHQTPFSAYNLRLHRQTYFGIRDLIRPLVQNREACMLPMQRAVAGKPWLIEICPAATLKRERLYKPYKGKTDGRYRTRVAILETIERLGPVIIRQKDLRSVVLDDSNGDALDSILAAFATFRAVRNSICLTVGSNTVYALEGYVYV